VSRRGAIAVGCAVALLAAAKVVWLSRDLAATTRAVQADHERAAAAQRRAAAAAILPGEGAPPAAEPICVRGVGTFVSAAARTERARLVADGALDLAALARLSRRAVAAERYAEQAAAGPALPQRMGRAPGPDGEWRPLAPDAIECDGRPSYAAPRAPR
jgi:hypothetical protein